MNIELSPIDEKAALLVARYHDLIAEMRVVVEAHEKENPHDPEIDFYQPIAKRSRETIVENIRLIASNAVIEALPRPGSGVPRA